MFVVFGATGNTGKVVAETLLAQALPVRVVVRDAAKAAALKARGAEVVVADLKDGRALTQALRGATGAYVLNPPNWAATDLVQNALEVGEALKRAIAESSVAHVVFLSSIGAQLPSGTGPIVTAHRLEQLFDGLKAHVTSVRAGYFMENLLSNLKPMQEQGVLPAMFNGEKRIEMVATADIGAVAAELLRQGKSAPKVVELSGPSPTSLADAAKAFSAGLGRPISLAPVPAAAQVDVLKSVGLNDAWARAFTEMGAGLDSGRVVFTGTPRRGLIGIDAFVAAALRKPA